MKITNLNKLKNKDLIVFDLDGTLAPTKAQMDDEMAKLTEKLLKAKKMAIIGGGKLELFKHQYLTRFGGPKSLFKNLSLFPTTGTTYLRYQGGWKTVYSHKLTKTEVKQVFDAFHKVLKEINYQPPKKIYGNVMEDRGSQVTWSALGQDVVKVLGKKGVEMKNHWRDHNTPLKLEIAKRVKKLIPNLEIHAAGHTSIDVTKKGIDKAYGIRQMQKYLKIPIKNMLFIGDAIFPGGNDYAVVKTKVDYVPVKNPEDTKKVIKYILEKL